jgi:hypothetical protein
MCKEAAASFRTAHGPDHPSTRVAEQAAAAPLNVREGSLKAAHEEAKAPGLSIDEWGRAKAKGMNPQFFCARVGHPGLRACDVMLMWTSGIADFSCLPHYHAGLGVIRFRCN